MADVVKRILTAADILEANDQTVAILDIPEWNGAVYVRTLNGMERDAFEQEFIDLRTGNRRDSWINNIRAKFAARVVCDENGKRLFTDEQIALLGKKNAAALDRIFEAGMSLNKFSSKDVEELTGN